MIMHEVLVDDGEPPRLRFDFSGRSRLSGVVTSEGRPLAGIDLVIGPPDQSLPMTALQTTRRGRYDARGLSEGLHLVLTRLGHFYEVQVAGHTTFDIRLPPTSLSGMVRSERTGMPVQATVQLHRGEEDDSPPVELSFRTVEGAFRFNGMAAGEYVASARADGFERLSRRVWIGGHETVTLDLTESADEKAD